jgi:hypothetical protein
MRLSDCLICVALSGLGFSSPLGRFFPRQYDQYGTLTSSKCPSSSVPVQTNEVQASIIKQQEWNLCSYKSLQGLITGTFTATCSSYGLNSMIPFTTTGGSPHATATFIATYITEYATLTSATQMTSTDCAGLVHTFSVGELGQGMLGATPFLHCNLF